MEVPVGLQGGDEEVIDKAKLRKWKISVSRPTRDAVFSEIVSHVGKPCPTNDEIGKAIGVDRNKVGIAISMLCWEGKLYRLGTVRRRGLRIVATGEETLLMMPKPSPAGQGRKDRRPERAWSPPQHVRYEDLPFDPDAGKFWPSSWPVRPSAMKSL